MRGALLVLNAGSSSIKFAVYAVAAGDPECLLRGQIAGIGRAARFTAQAVEDDAPETRAVEAVDHAQALDGLLDWLDETISDLRILGAGHRVVHGGPDRDGPRRIDRVERDALAAFIPLAPHHQPHNLAAIDALARRDPNLRQVACFDTAFHAHQEAVARRLPLPAEYEARGLLRYGFHGSSYEYVSGEVARMDRGVTRVLIAHLGNGGSLCAVRDGVSVATTMGFSTLDGLLMGTRCGALDPGVILHLLREGMGEEALRALLYDRSGLLGVSGISADMAVLLNSEAAGARRAVELYCHSLIRQMGAMIAAMEGVDALVFTGGIGENAAPIRERVCARLRWLGVALDAQANARNAREIGAEDSRVPVWVIPTDEERVIARHTWALIRPG